MKQTESTVLLRWGINGRLRTDTAASHERFVRCTIFLLCLFHNSRRSTLQGSQRADAVHVSVSLQAGCTEQHNVAWPQGCRGGKLQNGQCCSCGCSCTALKAPQLGLREKSGWQGVLPTSAGRTPERHPALLPCAEVGYTGDTNTKPRGKKNNKWMERTGTLMQLLRHRGCDAAFSSCRQQGSWRGLLAVPQPYYVQSNLVMYSWPHPFQKIPAVWSSPQILTGWVVTVYVFVLTSLRSLAIHPQSREAWDVCLKK